MKERQILECIEDMAIMQYRATKDDWWKKLWVLVVKKQGRKRND